MSALVETKRLSWAFEPGTEVAPGRTCVRLMGGGDRFEAWLGWDDHLAAPVVIKMLRLDQRDSSRARQAMAREAGTLGALAHPAIVRMFDADTTGDRPYLMLEFLDGPRLSTLVRRFEDSDGVVAMTDDDDDGDDGDDTRGDDGTSDGDSTVGEDGTSGGDDTTVGKTTPEV